jgi:DNA-binding SARP family transcriptional activator/pSer/pThr/pTyr-binding forkhead associated (FHA) protein
VRVGLLGPLEVVDGERPVEVGGARLQALLMRLALDAGRTVSRGGLVDAVWEDDVPADEVHALQSLVSRLRRALGDAALVAQTPGGYRLALDPAAVDAHRFERLARDGAAALRDGDPARAAQGLGEALGLWRGAALADLVDEPGLQAELRALEEDRLAAVATRMEAHLALGRHGEVTAELADLVAASPLHEHLRALLVLALYRSGRAADALAVLRDGRRVLADELGADPGPELRDLERKVLASEDLRGVERDDHPFLVFSDGGGEQRVVVLDPARSPVPIGRAADNAVALTWDREVSRAHARLERCRLGWVLVDTSRNGSLVDGKQVRGRRLLRDGAVLRIGETPLLFRSSSRGEPPVEESPVLVTVDAPLALLSGLPPRESDVLATILAAPEGAFGTGKPEELLAEALALPVEEVGAVVSDLCRQLGVRTDGTARVPMLGTRARAVGLGSA